MAVERTDANGWCRIRRGGQEKVMYECPPTVGDVDVKELGNQDSKFACPVTRCGKREAAVQAQVGARGVWRGRGGPGGAAARARVYYTVTLLLLQLKCTALWNLQPPCKPW